MFVLSWLLYFAFVIYVHFSPSYNSVGTMGVAFFSGKFYFNWLLVVGTCFAIDLCTSSYYILFGNNLAGTLMVLRKQRGTLDNNVDMPRQVEEYLKLFNAYGGPKVEDPNKAPYSIAKHVNLKDLDKIDRVQVDMAESKKIVIK